MAFVDAFCIDRWEDYVVELDADGVEREHSPYLPVDGLAVRAKTAPGVVPQGYISQVQAADACASAGKRLCSESAFHAACRGQSPGDLYPYGGRARKAGYCNEGKGSMMPRFYGTDAATLDVRRLQRRAAQPDRRRPRHDRQLPALQVTRGDLGLRRQPARVDVGSARCARARALSRRLLRRRRDQRPRLLLRDAGAPAPLPRLFDGLSLLRGPLRE